jgi:hypothetical protein
VFCGKSHHVKTTKSSRRSQANFAANFGILTPRCCCAAELADKKLKSLPLAQLSQLFEVVTLWVTGVAKILHEGLIKCRSNKELLHKELIKLPNAAIF